MSDQTKPVKIMLVEDDSIDVFVQRRAEIDLAARVEVDPA